MNHFERKGSLMCPIFFSALLLSQICFGQSQPGSTGADEKIWQEISSFMIKAQRNLNGDSAELEEIPLKKCGEAFAFFNKGNFWGNEIIINLNSTIKSTHPEMSEIRTLFYEYDRHFLPDSAFRDIQPPEFCPQHTKKGKPRQSNCKAFLSKDKQRIYIYLLNNAGSDPYEVTWIVDNKKYYGRVLNKL
jgi:hypothetical protein